MERMSLESSELDPAGHAGGARRDAWACAADSEDAADRSRWLVRTIEAEIIPRLMLVHSAPRERPRSAAESALRPGAAQVEDFVRVVLAENAGESAAFVAGLRDCGVALDVIYMELLAPAARRLGALWEADLCDFTQVTLGLWRIQQVMYDLSPAFHKDDVAAEGQPRRALLTPAPDSQHTFGLLMVCEFFRRAGWDVVSRTSAREPDLIDAAAEEWFDVCGISIGSECHLASVASVILGIRASSRNPAIVVMVGGPIVIAQPDIANLVGADATSGDALGAVCEAERLVAACQRFC